MAAETGAAHDNTCTSRSPTPELGIPAAEAGPYFRCLCASGWLDDAHASAAPGWAWRSPRNWWRRWAGASGSRASRGKGQRFISPRSCSLRSAVGPRRERRRKRPAVSRDPNGLRILLAEDNVINSAVVTGLLARRTLVYRATNGREAVEAAPRGVRLDLDGCADAGDGRLSRQRAASGATNSRPVATRRSLP